MALTSVRGRYEGEVETPTAGGHMIDLRVDLDERYANSPVLSRISGDLFQLNRIVLPGRPPEVWRVYRESWVIENPVTEPSAQPNQTVVSGAIRFYKGFHPPMMARIVIARLPNTATAQVSLLKDGVLTSSFNCVLRSDCFRELSLEVDVCQSVFAASGKTLPLPSYDTQSSNIRPPHLARRTLTIEEAYREAGVLVNISRSPVVVNDVTPAPIPNWSSADLHHAMEEHFTQFPKTWPRWDMWGLLATSYTNRRVGGIMFDTAAQFDGAGKPPERQGFAVFRNHEWFDDLKAGAPTTDAEIAAARQYLYTWVHEAGHAFNFL